MTEHAKSIDAIPVKEPVQRFQAPGRSEVFACIRYMALIGLGMLGIMILGASEPVSELLPLSSDNRVFLVIWLLTCTMATLMLLGMVVPRLEIRGDAIRSKSISSLYRWRSWSVHEVVGMEVRAPADEVGAVMYVWLAPSPQRSWNLVVLGGFSPFSSKEGIDNRFFIAIAEAVTAANPSMGVRLPENYSGALNWFRKDD